MVLALLAFSSVHLFSQNLVNGPTGKIINIGTITFINNTSVFQNENPNNALNGDAYKAEVSGSSGTIKFQGTGNTFTGTNVLGAADASRIAGWVLWAGASGTQNIQGRYYTNLGLAGGAIKSYGAAQVNVDHVYAVASGSGDRDYGTSTFIYDGDVAGTEDQTIFPESGASGGNNIYYTLRFENSGIKTLAQGTTANSEFDVNLQATATNVTILGTMNAFGTVTTAAGSVLNIGGDNDANKGELTEDGFFRSGDGAGTLAGNVFIFNDGTYITDGTGLQTFTGAVQVGYNGITSSSGSLTLQDGDVTIGSGGSLNLQNVNGHIVAGAGRTLEIATSSATAFANQVAYGTGVNERSNMEFDVTSTVLYSGANNLLGTSKNYPYGNLSLTGAAKSSENGADHHAYVAGNFSLAGANLTMDNNTNPTDGSAAIAMLNPAKTVTIADGLDVIGAFRHYYGANGLGALTFNNAQTKIEVTDNGTGTEYMELRIYPSGPPTASDYAPGTDVHRRYYLAWNMTSGDWTATIQAAYLPSEYTGSASDEQQLRFREYTSGNVSEKIATGYAVQRQLTATNGFKYASLAGITSSASASITLARFGDQGPEFLLRGGPTWFITIANGRWSNPATWDEGVQPGPNDYCLVRHTVHAGYVRATDNYNVNENVHLENNFGGETIANLTAYIEVFTGTMGATSYTGALMMGSGDGTNSGDVLTANANWGLNEGATITGSPASPSGSGNIATAATLDIYGNNGDATNLPTYTGGAINDVGSNAIINQGSYLLVFSGATFSIATELTNTGHIVNAGTINVGQ